MNETIEIVVRVAIAGLLLGGAAAKLRSPSATRSALATYGIAPRWRQTMWSSVVVVELALGTLVLAGSDAGAYAAAALFAIFAAVLAWAIARGHEGQPCGCLGSGSRVGNAAVGRNVVAAGAAASAPAIGTLAISDVTLLQIGLAVALVAIGGLAVALLALAREVGELRMLVRPESALEIADEGPEIGSATALDAHFAVGGPARYRVAVFSSEACPVCASLEPSVDLLARDSLLDVRVFDEHRDAAVWNQLDVPGSPYGVILDLEGTVLAKGTFNSLGQLQGLIAGAASRRTAYPAPHVRA